MRKIAPKTLFWGKYSHSVKLENKLFSYRVIRENVKRCNWNIDQHIKEIESSLPVYLNSGPRWGRSASIEDVAEFKVMRNAFVKFLKKETVDKVRIEYNAAIFYTNSNALAEFLKESCATLIKAVSAPLDQNHEQVLRANAAIPTKFKIKTVKALPENKWKYKINLTRTASLLDDTNLGELLKGYHDMGEAQLPQGFIMAMNSRNKLISHGRFVRIKDEDTLGMLCLALGQKYLLNVEEYRVY